MLAGLHVVSRDFQVKLESAGGRVIHKISVNQRLEILLTSRLNSTRST